MTVAGTYHCAVKAPSGEKELKMIVIVDGATFTGSISGSMGNSNVYDGQVDGNEIAWKVNVTSPMKLTMSGKATIDGDTLTGTVKAGAFAGFPITGTRVG